MCVLAAIFPSALHAQNLHIPNEGIAGLGMVECEQIVQWDEQNTSMHYLVGWVHGWWTGYNLYLAEKGKPLRDTQSDGDGVTSLHGLERIIVGHCVTEPDSPLVKVAADIFDLLPELDPTVPTQ